MFQLFNFNKRRVSLDSTGVTQIQEQVQQGIRHAEQQVRHERADKAKLIATVDRDRARELIAAIPEAIDACARQYFRRGWREVGADFDCEFAVMRLKRRDTLENEDELIFYHTDESRPADPTKLLHAARLVFDFCNEAGYNPVVVSRATKCIGGGVYQGCFEIKLRLNIPDEMKLSGEETQPQV